MPRLRRAGRTREAEDDASDDDEPELEAEESPEAQGEETAKALNEYAVGQEFMLHRRLVSVHEQSSEMRWKTCHGTDDGHAADSRVHRYDRVIGFKPSEEDAAEIAATESVRQAWERRRQEAVKFKSHHRRVELQAVFERWCLARAATSPYCGYLRGLETAAATAEEDDVELSNEERVMIMPPPQALVLTFMDELRLDPTKSGDRVYDHKGGTIKNSVVAISSTCSEFGAARVGSADAIKEKLKKWLKTDGHSSSKAFDMEKDMKTMWNVIWTITAVVCCLTRPRCPDALS